MKHTLLIKDWLYSFLSLWFPRCCVVCGGSLAKGEECICTMCNINLPRTDYHLRKDNPVEKLFWGKFPLERATSFFFYRKGSDFRQVLHQLKYGGQKEIGAIMGRYMASELQASDFFHGVDVIIPIPLHKKKQQIRGYNQSEWISRGIIYGRNRYSGGYRSNHTPEEYGNANTKVSFRTLGECRWNLRIASFGVFGRKAYINSR